MLEAYTLVLPVRGGEPNAVQRRSDGAFIPFDPDNVDYQMYLAWVADGNAPLSGDL